MAGIINAACLGSWTNAVFTRKALSNIYRLALVSAVLFISACTEDDPKAKARDRAVDSVKRILKDPYSAQFSEIKVNASSVCGLVNSRNSFGGYVGSKRFFVDEEHKLLWVQGQSSLGLVPGKEKSMEEFMNTIWELCQLGDPVQNSN